MKIVKDLPTLARIGHDSKEIQVHPRFEKLPIEVKTRFPNWHFYARKQTNFVEKIWKSIQDNPDSNQYKEEYRQFFGISNIDNFAPKYHEIISGGNFKVGDDIKLSVIINSYKVYDFKFETKEIQIAPILKIHHIFYFQKKGCRIILDGRTLSEFGKDNLAKNNGLTSFELTMCKDFKGQLICWDKRADYSF